MTDKFLLLLIVVATGLLYIPLNRRKSKYYWGSALDRKIPLVPVFIFPYIYFFFPYLAIGFLLLIGSPIVLVFLKSFVVANIIAAIIWYVFPNGVKRPKVIGSGFLKKMIGNLYKFDKYESNGFPSSHVYYTSIITWYLVLAVPQYSLMFWFVGISIVLSTLFTKQHYIIDVIGGLTLSLISIYLAKAF